MLQRGPRGPRHQGKPPHLPDDAPLRVLLPLVGEVEERPAGLGPGLPIGAARRPAEPAEPEATQGRVPGRETAVSGGTGAALQSPWRVTGLSGAAHPGHWAPSRPAHDPPGMGIVPRGCGGGIRDQAGAHGQPQPSCPGLQGRPSAGLRAAARAAVAQEEEGRGNLTSGTPNPDQQSRDNCLLPSCRPSPALPQPHAGLQWRHRALLGPDLLPPLYPTTALSHPSGVARMVREGTRGSPPPRGETEPRRHSRVPGGVLPSTGAVGTAAGSSHGATIGSIPPAQALAVGSHQTPGWQHLGHRSGGL